jgi:hypothetical protein
MMPLCQKKNISRAEDGNIPPVPQNHPNYMLRGVSSIAGADGTSKPSAGQLGWPLGNHRSLTSDRPTGSDCSRVHHRCR